jgi:flavin reductase (DIM6/NTAB) family NADH-FMN oxidoreductase RutF
MSIYIRFSDVIFSITVFSRGAKTMESEQRAAFISAMRRVASSVCVVTTDGVGGRHGATVSAFSSVCADPPTVLVCLNTASTIAARVAENNAFRVNVLPDGASDLAGRFAGMHDDQVVDRFDGVAVTGALPAIEGATTFACDLSQSIVEGTHLICIGRVVDVTLGGDVPLTYLAGSYQTLTPKEGS